MLVAGFKRNLNYKDINKKSKNIKLIFNFNLSEEAENHSLTLSSIPLLKITHKNSNKILKSQKSIQKDKKKQILKDQKLHNLTLRNKETNWQKKDSTMTLLAKSSRFQTEQYLTSKIEANWHMTQKKGESLNCRSEENR